MRDEDLREAVGAPEACAGGGTHCSFPGVFLPLQGVWLLPPLCLVCKCLCRLEGAEWSRSRAQGLSTWPWDSFLNFPQGRDAALTCQDSCPPSSQPTHALT